MSEHRLELWLPIGAYLVGAIPFAFLIGRLAGVDLRVDGSGNVGAGNLTRTVGLPAGIGVAFLDGLKGLVPTYLAGRLGLAGGLVAMTGMAAVAGHNWSVWLRGRSGRGLATSVGVVAALDPVLVLWTALWAAAGWKLRGGLGGFVGWSTLPMVAAGWARPAPAALLAFGLATLMVTRRIQGNPDRRSGVTAGLYRAIFDEDPGPAEEMARA
ncbi:MAG: glycerol-3-phosphate acyltransferase [Acidimicrobiia bacterium]